MAIKPYLACSLCNSERFIKQIICKYKVHRTDNKVASYEEEPQGIRLICADCGAVAAYFVPNKNIKLIENGFAPPRAGSDEEDKKKKVE